MAEIKEGSFEPDLGLVKLRAGAADPNYTLTTF
jgi:hypothetical protein